MRQQPEPLDDHGVGGVEVLLDEVAAGGLAQLPLGVAAGERHLRVADPEDVRQQRADELTLADGAARPLPVMAELLEERHVTVNVDQQLRVLNLREHLRRELGELGLLDLSLGGRLAGQPEAVVQHSVALLVAVLQQARQLSLLVFELRKPLLRRDGPVEHSGQLALLSEPLHARHHPARRVAIAVAGGAVQAAGA